MWMLRGSTSVSPAAECTTPQLSLRGRMPRLAVIDAAGIYISTYSSDGDFEGRCIEIKVRGVRHNA